MSRTSVIASSIFVAFVCAAAAAALLAPVASADTTLCSPGTGAGQCSSPEGVAVDYATGRVFVADRANNRIDVFAANGSFIKAFGWGVDTGAAAFQSCTTASTCQAGIAGEGSGQFNRPRSIAVDNDPASPSFHDVYVVDYENLRVEKFTPEGEFILTFGGGVNKTTSSNLCTASSGDTCGAGTNGTAPGQLSRPVAGISSRISVGVGPTGTLYLTDNSDSGCRFKKFTSEGEFLSQTILCGNVNNERVTTLAVESGGDFFAFIEVARTLDKYDALGNLSEPRASGTETSGLALDEANNLYVEQRQLRVKSNNGLYGVITRYNTAGAILRRWGYGFFSSNREVELAAPHATAGNVYASEEGGSVRFLEEPQKSPIAAPILESEPGNVRATLSAEINPEGKATEYHFQYVDQHSFETEGGWSSPNVKSTPVTPLGGAADFELHLAQAQIGCTEPLTEAGEGKCLNPETSYRFRVIATNADNPSGEGVARAEGSPFTTKPPLDLISTYATQVGSDSARLSVRVNPLGILATGYFEYVDEAAYEQDKAEGGDGFGAATQVPPLSAGASPLDFGAGQAALTRSVSLALKPATTYRYRAVVDDPMIEPVVGEEAVLRTFAPLLSEPCAANEAFRVGPSATLPDCRAYEMVSPLEKENGDILAQELLAQQVPAALNQSSLSGERVAYGSYRAFGDAQAAPYTSEYVAARGPSGWSSHSITPKRGRMNLEFTEAAINEVWALSPDLCQAWLKTVAEPTLAPGALVGFPNLYRRSDEQCGGPSYLPLTTTEPAHANPKAMGLRGVAADGSAAIYTWADNLPGTEAPDLGGEGQALYYQRPGAEPHYVCVLPSGAPLHGQCAAGTASGSDFSQNVHDSVHNAISAHGDRVFWSEALKGPAKLYVRINPDLPQSAVKAGACTEPELACTVAVSKQAESLTGSEKSSTFWDASADGNLVIFTTGTDLYTYDLETKVTTLIAHKSPGVMGASEDASRIYFASEEDLPSEPNSNGDLPQAGKPNLYLYEAGSYRFIATLVTSTDLEFSNSGRPFLAITGQPRKRTSRVNPSGLTATFMTTGQPTGYDNTDAASGPNCGETGGRCDMEVYLYRAQANEGKGELICASCNPTGARPAGADNLGPSNNKIDAAAYTPYWANTLYAPRSLSADGTRLFFNTTDRLTPRDTNGALDVYEWEAPGTGGCSKGAPDYYPSNQGCLRLVSSGQSAASSQFADASPDGHDVFFTTLSSLVPQDYGLVDLYDARVGGGFPAPAQLAAGCEGEACQGPSSPPSDPTPASSAFQGPGNVVEPKAKKKAKKKARAKHKTKNKHKHKPRKVRKANAKGRTGR